jgi:predicted nucleotidyltransferase
MGMAELLLIEARQVADFCARHQVSELAVFGSALRSDFDQESDVDILVSFAPGAKISLFDLVDMTDELAKIIGRRVDLVTKQGLKPQIRQSILDSSRVIYAAA